MCLLISAAVRADEDPLGRAKELYRSAAYDEALGILDSISTTATPDNLEVNEFRVFCLVALDRKEEARNAIAALITADPSYQLSENQASPRVRAVFKEVRQSLLPSLVQRAYADAKTAFDRKDPQAPAQFDRVLALLHDADVAANPELTDLAVVAAAFRDLSVARDTAAAASKTPSAPAASSNGAAAGNAAKPAEPPVYRDGEPNLTPAVTISQIMPTAPLPERRLWTGAVQVLIDETGKVISAQMATPIYGPYDRQLIQAAQGWKYRPALKNGVAVRYIKIINIRVDSRPECSTFESAQCRPAN
jgi:hypothetical protein